MECAGSSGAVHSVFLIGVYLDLENPGGSGFWVRENRRVTKRVSLPASGSRGGWILTQKEGSKSVDKGNKGNKGSKGEQGEQGEQRGTRGIRGRSCT